MISVSQMLIQAASVHWRMQFVARMDFRHVRWISRFKDYKRIQALLSAVYYTLPHNRAKVKKVLRQARAHLKDIRTWQSPSPPANGSPLAYTPDPATIRRLNLSCLFEL